MSFFIKRSPAEVATKASATAPTNSPALTDRAGGTTSANEAIPPSEGHANPIKNARTRDRSFILEGPIAKGVFRVAYPSVATMLLQTTNSLLDRGFVGTLGPASLAAVTVSNTLMFALMSGAMAISVGTTALVARAIGEGDVKSAERATQQSLILSFLIALVVGGVMWLGLHPLLRALGLDKDALPLAERYLRITIWGMPTLFLMLTLNGAFRGIGDTVKPFWVTLGTICIHASANYLLIFGNFGFPKMGLSGGALALTLSQLVGMILYIVFLRQSVLRNTPRSFAIDWGWAWRIARIGLPASAQQFIRVGSMLAFQGMLTTLGAGTAAIAALGVGLTSESIAFMPGFGYSIAASAFVGQNLGAGKVDRANKGAWIAMAQAILVMSVMGVVFWTFAEPASRLLIRHVPGETVAQGQQTEETIRLSVEYLRIAAWSEPFLGVGMVLTGALQGAGETLSPTLITIVTMVCLRLPLTYVLARTFGWGTHGAWWAMSISTMVNGVLVAALFKRGKWRNTKV